MNPAKISGWKIERLTDDVIACVHPEGQWGVNNIGLVCEGTRASVLVDTLFTGSLTEQMVGEMKKVTAAAADVEIVINTHANGDHCWGNGLFSNAEIIASKAAAKEMEKVTPKIMRKLMALAKIGKLLGPVRAPLVKFLRSLGADIPGSILDAAPYLMDIFGAFDFDTSVFKAPTLTFSKEMVLSFGPKQIVLKEFGPAHTAGDVVVFIPEDRVVFAGDLLFLGGHPLLWEGPVANWISALDYMLSIDAKTIVPGHGPTTDRDGVLHFKNYFSAIAEQSRALFDAGVPLNEAVHRIDLGPFKTLREAERLIVNVDTLYREFRGDGPRTSTVPLFATMAAYRKTIPAAG